MPNSTWSINADTVAGSPYLNFVSTLNYGTLVIPEPSTFGLIGLSLGGVLLRTRGAWSFYNRSRPA